MLLSATHISRQAAEALPGMPDLVVLSITDLRARPAELREGHRDVLRLAFDDVLEATQWDGIDRLPITPEQARQIIEWLEHWHSEPTRLRLITHCEAGISRSAAVARFAAETFGFPLPHEVDYPFCNATVLRQLRAAL
jgi:predicted protein tyrosine phosphatase